MGLWDLFLTLDKYYPGDPGILCMFFLNIVKLEVGEAIYIEPNDIHAYISGDAIECMACSDNVIRAGLTTKLKDIDRLLDCLSYRTENRECKKLYPRHMNQHTLVFGPPVIDFSVLSIRLEDTKTTPYEILLPKFPGILLVVSGNRNLRLRNGSIMKLKRGSIIYLSAENMEEIDILKDPCMEEGEPFQAYLATTNILPEYHAKD